MNFLVKIVSMVQSKSIYLVGTWPEEIYRQNRNWILHRRPIFKFPQIQVLQSKDVLLKRDTKICLGYWTSASEYVNGFGKLRDNFLVA